MKNWEKLLRFLYEHDEKWENYAEGDTGINRTHPFVTDVGLSIKEARSAFSFLKRHNLIEGRGDFIQLTTKGFEVIRDQDFKRDQTEHNKALVMFTVILAIISILDIIAAEITPDSLYGTVSLGAITIVLLISIYFLAKPFLPEM